ncbi:MAG: FmdB family zinc ribbon protein [Chthonomonadales bacterium]
MMPLYEYLCTDCRTRFEVLLQSPAAAPALCPNCGSSSFRRLISTFAISRSLVPCGVPASDKPASCSAAADGGCACCGAGRQGFDG